MFLFLYSDKLVQRVTDGLGSDKYAQVDYEKLRAMATEKKFSSHKSLIKMKKIEQMSKQTKEGHILKQHKMVWQKEFSRLNSHRKKLQADIDIHVRQGLLDPQCTQLFQDLEEFENLLASDFAKFKEATTSPIWALR